MKRGAEKTKMSSAVEAAHIKEVTREHVHHFNTEFRHIIQEYDIKLENIY